MQNSIERLHCLLLGLNNYIQKNAKPDFFASVYPGVADVSGLPNRVSLGVLVFGREPRGLIVESKT